METMIKIFLIGKIKEFVTKEVYQKECNIDWDNEDKYKAVAKHILEVGHKLGVNLEWGGDWKFRDFPHIQLAGADKVEFKK